MGYALKVSGKQYENTKKVSVLTFVLFLYNLGVQNKANKISAEKAVDLMKKFGTVEGRNLYPNDVYWTPNENGNPTFNMCDILDIQQFKSYFGQSKAKLDATLAARLRNNTNNVNDDNNGNNGNQSNNNLSQASIRIIEFCEQESIPEAAGQLIQMKKNCTITDLKRQLDINYVHHKSS